MKIIQIKKDKYVVRGAVSIDTGFTFEELKEQWRADNVLKNYDTLYLCEKVIDAEFEDIE